MIFVPFTFIHPPTWEALNGWPVVPWRVEGDDGYLTFFEERWKECLDFIVVEHDVVAQPGQVSQLWACPEPWCCFPELGGSPSLSLVRFREPFIRANRDLWERLRRSPPAGQRPIWTWLDSHLVKRAKTAPHLHLDPPAVNQRPYGSLH